MHKYQMKTHLERMGSTLNSSTRASCVALGVVSAHTFLVGCIENKDKRNKVVKA
jgi:hypothetical protein